MSTVSVVCVEESIFQLKIDSPETDNRLGMGVIQDLQGALGELAQTSELKVLILSGTPQVFSAGADLELLQKLAAGEISETDLAELPRRLLEFPVPVIAALEGHAVGGGLCVALSCDITVASERSRYGVNFTNLGFTPGIGTTFLLPSVLGHHFASEMILTGRLYRGRDLQGKNVFNHIVAPEDVMEKVMDIARSMAEKPKLVLELLKQTLSIPRRQAFLEAVSQEQLMHNICFSNQDAIRYIRESYIS